MRLNAAAPLIESLDGDHPALVVGGRTTTSEALRDRALGLAVWLKAKGVQPGDRAVLLVPPGPDFTAALLALVWVGAAPVLMDAGQPAAVRRSRLSAAAPAWVVTVPLLAGAWALRLPALFERLPERPPVGALLVLPRAARGDCEAVARPPEGEALMVFTSGTTGAPRGVIHTHGNLGHFLAHVEAVVDGLPVGTYLAETPQQIFYALLMRSTCYLVKGQGEKRLDRTMAVLGEQPVEAWFGSPWTWQAWLDRGLPAPEGLRTLIFGSAPVSRPFLRRLGEFLPESVSIRCVYGLTEVGPACWIDGREKAHSAAAGDPVGRPLPAVRLRLVEGEVQVSSPSLAARYMGEGAIGEWLTTGDLGRIDEDGLTLVGRKKDMIIRRSVNLYPGLYEPVLLETLEDAALIGVYDHAAEDERVVLIYVGAEGATGAELGEATPDHVWRVEALPRAGRQNKVDKGRLREMARERFQIP